MDTNPYDDFQHSYQDIPQNEQPTKEEPPFRIDYDPTEKIEPPPRRRGIRKSVPATLATIVMAGILVIVGTIGLTRVMTGRWLWQHSPSENASVVPTQTARTGASPLPTTSGAATPVSQPTVTTTALACKQLLVSTNAATTGSTKVVITFPAQTVIAPWQDHFDPTLGYQQRVIPACTANSSPTAIINTLQMQTGWTTTTGAAGCGDNAVACITKTITVSNVSVAEYVSIAQIQDFQGTERYTIMLAVAPLAHQDATSNPTAGTPYWSFADPNPTQFTADFQYSNGQIKLTNSALFAYQPGTTLSNLTDDYCAMISTWDYHPGDTITIKPETPAVLQDSRGNYVALVYTSESTFQWSTFLFGF